MKKVFVLCLLSSMLFSFTVSDSYAKKKEIKLGEVVVTGTRTERNIKDVPVRTEVISSKKIEDKGATNLYQALDGESGIRVEEQCSYCNFSMIRLQGLSGDHTQMLIDGQPVYSGLAGVYGLQQVSASAIERIEVVKGAGSALYGSSAIAGVVNIITKKPAKEPEVKFDANMGSWGTNSYNLLATRRLGNMDILITGAKNTGAPIYNIEEDKDKPNYDTELKNITDRVKTDNTLLGTKVSWYDVFTSDDQVSVFGRTYNEARQGGDITTYANPFAEGTENIQTTRYETGVGYKRALLNGGQLNLNASYVDHVRNATNDTFVGDYLATHGDIYPPSDELEPYLASENLFVLDGSISQPLLNNQTLLVGGQFSNDSLSETGKYVDIDPASPTYSQTYRSESEKGAVDYGVFIQDEIALADNMELVVGARYDFHYSQDNFGGSGDAAPLNRIMSTYKEESISPRLAFKMETSPNMTIRASAGTGFRVPYGFSEDLHLCSGSPRVYKPADLRPERSVSANFSVDHVEDSFSWGANIFRTDLQDKIDFADASAAAQVLGYDYQWENIGPAYTQGVELAAGWNFMPEVGLDVDLAYTDAQYDEERGDWVTNHPQYAAESKYISRVPQISGGIKLAYDPEVWGINIDADYTGSMYIDYNANDDIADPASKIVKTEPYWIINTKVNRKLSKEQTVYAGARNLLSYVQPEKHPDDAAFMYAPYYGRIIYAGMEITL